MSVARMIEVTVTCDFCGATRAPGGQVTSIESARKAVRAFGWSPRGWTPRTAHDLCSDCAYRPEPAVLARLTKQNTDCVAAIEAAL